MKYQVTYRGEFEVIIDANSEEEAKFKADRNENWRFILDVGHSDFYEITPMEEETKTCEICHKPEDEDGRCGCTSTNKDSQ